VLQLEFGVDQVQEGIAAAKQKKPEEDSKAEENQVLRPEPESEGDTPKGHITDSEENSLVSDGPNAHASDDRDKIIGANNKK